MPAEPPRDDQDMRRIAGLSHDIAVRAVGRIVKDSLAAGLDWKDMLVSCETTLAGVAVVCAELSGVPDRVAFVTEVIDTMTEQAHKRAVAGLCGVPFVG